MIVFRLLSRLPLTVLYGLSDFLYFLLLYVVRYRKRVVLENLRLSFPEKSPAEIKSIARGFYRNLTDLIVETIKMPALSADELRKRVQFTNAEIVKQQLQAGQAVVGMASHSSNWEWIPSSSVLHGMPADSIYKPLNNPFFEKLMREIRSTFGAVPVPMHTLPRRMAAQKDSPRIIALVADQVPDVPEQAFWTDFLHHDTPFYPGTERLARSRQLPVFYTHINRIRRGYYQVTFTAIGQPPYTDLPEGAILERYRDLLEETIRAYPSDWLWSHKRWKHWRGKYPKIATKLT
ncbi:lysophospholipid acyltransferase family protein [Spirosoma sp. KUDC1026]|uniref:lysophospholipid acyltransferase family protein n=1 Tax=Spirosoma sp. KUDC1026 TaxID=2745947 RepID=UPI00159BD4BA|nr:lysophospholipid acyltransferase family protein [Spirosoma sp. KUDC1026]QKZ13091.1 lysophospholipid acyltransferase family protein [Spirosoma sp. KUDC1026]